MELIDRDALLDDAMERYCKNCDRRKGVKNGEWRIIYEIGDAPCRACSVDDMKCEIEDAPTVDAVPVVRCKECVWNREKEWVDCYMSGMHGRNINNFCSRGERKEE